MPAKKDLRLIAPSPSPSIGAKCRCGRRAAVHLSGCWFADGADRAYCMECHLSGTWRRDAAMRLQAEQELRRSEAIQKVRHTSGATLLAVAMIWAWLWTSASGHASASELSGAVGDPAWHWLIIVPLGLLGWALLKEKTECEEGSYDEELS